MLLLLMSGSHAAESPLVAAASNMSHVLTEIADAYHAETHRTVRLSFGSSGNFTRQILQGAPYSLFISADRKYLDILRQEGLQITTNSIFAYGRIGIFIPATSPLAAKTDLQDIMHALYNGSYRRLAIANPDYAPYGTAAMQSLQSAGLWVIEKGKLLIGESAAQTMQITLTGGVDLGIIPASYAKLPGIMEQGKFFLIPETWHKPVIQYLVLLDEADQPSRQFYNYLLTDATKQILHKYGYVTEDNHSSGEMDIYAAH
jgi:molybdate transport system substrate-binding protein